MTFPGGNLGDTTQRIKYSARFLGQTKSNASTSFTTVACQRAGTGGQNLPIAVTLQEGGTTKVPAPNYLDTMTVTVTPLAMPYGGSTANCPGL
jgi:spore coat protein U-like protein